VNGEQGFLDQILGVVSAPTQTPPEESPQARG
jgi:hypothetical protein